MAKRLKPLPCVWCGENRVVKVGPGIMILKIGDVWLLRHWCHELTTLEFGEETRQKVIAAWNDRKY